MPDPSTYRPAPGTIPLEPGVYKFRDPRGRVIYVGKAKSLRQRLNSYFADVARAAPAHPADGHHARPASSGRSSRTEVEALQLEYNWIKEFDPRFNVRYRDDKSYPSLAVTLYEEYPRLQVMRGPKRKGVRYFGPYAHAWAIRETLDLLLRVFPARTCSRRRVQARRADRPALPARLHRQVQRAVRRPGHAPTSTAQIVDDFCDFMAGKTDPMIRRLERQMAEASARPGVRAGRPAARRPRARCAGAMEKQAVVLRRRHRRRRRRLRRGRPGGRGPGLPRARRPGPRPARLGRRQAATDDRPPASWSSSSSPQFYG